jgi:catechol 2,3-dioxygenase-like lactoylglutathione lyase family enzyme
MPTTLDAPTNRASASPGNAPMTRAPGIPSSHHHLAYSTHDTRATIDFYTRVLGMPLVEAVLDDRLPSTGAPYPYLHTFFRMLDGTCIAFFESPGVPKMPPIEHPALKIFNHLAMEVPTRGDVDQWAQWLKANGVEVTVVDHGIIYSVYFHDPVNGIRLELTATLDPNWNDKPAEAAEAVEQWYETHRQAESTGTDVREALRALAVSRSNQAKVKATNHG